MTREGDEPIWAFAAKNGFTIVSKDTDFMHRALLRGHPPKFIHLRVGNCSTTKIERLLESKKGIIEEFLNDPLESLLAID